MPWQVFTRAGSDVLVMQCTSTYPCPPEQVNLRAMVAMAERFGTLVGLSDHTPDVYASVGAVALGAVAVEKHFTLSRLPLRPGPQGVAGARGPRAAGRGVREVHLALGIGREGPRPGARPGARDVREDRSSAASRSPRARRSSWSMLTTKRPGNGIPGHAHLRRSSGAHGRADDRRQRPAGAGAILADRRRKICVVVASRANYARIKYRARRGQGAPRPRAAGRRRRLDAAGAHRQRRRRHGARRLRAGRHACASSSRARRPRRWRSRPGSACSSCRRSSRCSQPDVVVTVADRFETIATAIAAAYMNIPVAHTQGGEVSGSIDESVRHAVTKLAPHPLPGHRAERAARARHGRGPATTSSTSAARRSTSSPTTDLGLAARRAAPSSAAPARASTPRSPTS